MVEVVVFILAAVVCVVGALGVVLARNPVHSALMLVMTLFGIAVLFVAQEAHFLAVVQVIVYAGAIVVLILFVIMLLGVDEARELQLRALPAQLPAALVFAAVSLGVLVAVVVSVDDPATGLPGLGGAIDDSVPNVEQLAISLFGDYVYAFELTSVLLVIAVVSAVVLARRPSRQERAQLEALRAEDLAAAEAERAEEQSGYDQPDDDQPGDEQPEDDRTGDERTVDDEQVRR